MMKHISIPQKSRHLFLLKVGVLILMAGISTLPLTKAENQSSGKARTLTNLLEYIGRDYAEAVKDGKVVNDLEYKEMKEFTQRSVQLFHGLFETPLQAKINRADSLHFENRLEHLRLSIEQKAPIDTIARITEKLKQTILGLEAFAMTPEDPPSLAQGKKVYIQKCAQCHGKSGKGNGPSAGSLNPAPTNFLEEEPNPLSPFQAFNVVKLGIEGTAMRSYDELSDDEIWSVAFYLASLPHREQQMSGTPEKANVSLKSLATHSDKQLLKKLEGDSLIKQEQLAFLRLNLNDVTSEKKDAPFRIAKNYLDEALKLYEEGNVSEAESKAVAAYLEGIEPIESKLKATSPSTVNTLENRMASLRSSISQEKSKATIEVEIDKALAAIEEAEGILNESDFSFWSASFLSASILLREGLEAFLIIITILSVLRAAGARYAVRWVHSGWITALLIGIAGWFFTDWLLAMGGSNREIMEGFGALLAVLILLYLGFWFHDKTEAKRWQAFVQNKIGKALQTRNLIGLFAVAFIVVFREAFESVLFLSALNLEGQSGASNGIWVGALFAGLLITVIAWLVLRYSKRLPVATLFKYSAVIISILAIVMAGQGIHAFQESGFLSITALPFDGRLSLIGFYPSYEILLAQGLVAILTIALWYLSKKRITA